MRFQGSHKSDITSATISKPDPNIGTTTNSTCPLPLHPVGNMLLSPITDGQLECTFVPTSDLSIRMQTDPSISLHTPVSDPSISSQPDPSISSSMDPRINTSTDPSISATPDMPLTQLLMPAQSHRFHYHVYQGSLEFQHQKCQRGIDGHIFVHPTDSRLLASKEVSETPKIFPHVFSAFYDLPVIHSESTFQAFMAYDNKANTLTQSQMLKMTHAQDFIHSQHSEIAGLEKMGDFSYHNISQLPPHAKLLNSIWSYRRKHRPDGALIKHKSRLCVNGSQQRHGRDYWEIYAPVVTWSFVHLILLLPTIMQLKSCQVDYTQAFHQAELHDPVFM